MRRQHRKRASTHSTPCCRSSSASANGGSNCDPERRSTASSPTAAMRRTSSPTTPPPRSSFGQQIRSITTNCAHASVRSSTPQPSRPERGSRSPKASATSSVFATRRWSRHSVRTLMHSASRTRSQPPIPGATGPNCLTGSCWRWPTAPGWCCRSTPRSRATRTRPCRCRCSTSPRPTSALVWPRVYRSTIWCRPRWHGILDRHALYRANSGS